VSLAPGNLGCEPGFIFRSDLGQRKFHHYNL
jgi:hypothetical protein